MKIIHKQLSFDSTDEIFMYQWLLQLKQHNIIDQIVLQPESFELSQKVTHPITDKSLLRPHVYTADFKITFKNKHEKLKQLFNLDYQQYYIQVKPGFDRSNMTRLFTINQKWIYQKFGVYIFKFQVDKLFKKSFVPQFCRFTQKTKKQRDKYKQLLGIKQFLQL